jgi:hypothetical protein
MNKIELIQALKDSNHLSKSEAETVINLFFDKMTEALAKGDRVEIRCICSFFVKKYNGYTGCHQCDEFPCHLIENFPMTVGKKVIMRYSILARGWYRKMGSRRRSPLYLPKLW